MLKRASAQAALWGAIAVFVAGCAADLTEVVVVVESDLAVPTQLDEVVVEVEGAAARGQRAVASLVGEDAAGLPLTLGLRPGSTGAGPLSVRVAGKRAGAEFVATRVRTRFVEGRRVLLRVVLRGACVGVTCETGTTCREGACADEFVDPATLPSFTGTIGAFDAGPGVDLGTDVSDAGEDGSAPPPDAAMDAGGCTADPLTPCALGEGYCVEGVLRCESGNLECRPGETRLSAGTVCREPRGVCDVAEACDGTSAACPRDDVAPTSVVCRMPAGGCDRPENCDGAERGCPADDFFAVGVPCRPSEGDCDVPEVCTGLSAGCPPDALAPAGAAPCRPTVAGGCDLPETCSGTSSTCPADEVAPVGSACPAGFCAGSSPACMAGCTPNLPCEVPGAPCSEGRISCAGGTPVCMATGPRAAGTECRPARGMCDVAEQCDGVVSACPVDVFLGPDVECRPASGDCDQPEACSGAAPDCPADGVIRAGGTCRGAAGACDRAESCDGVGKACPADGFLTAGTECRAASGMPCDAPEVCSGLSASCPFANALRPSGYVCRAVNTATGCDAAETCNGLSDKCPTDAYLADRARCLSPYCGGECRAGACSGGVICALGYSCSSGMCIGLGPPDES